MNRWPFIGRRQEVDNSIHNWLYSLVLERRANVNGAQVVFVLIQHDKLQCVFKSHRSNLLLGHVQLGNLVVIIAHLLNESLTMLQQLLISGMCLRQFRFLQ